MLYMIIFVFMMFLRGWAPPESWDLLWESALQCSWAPAVTAKLASPLSIDSWSFFCHLDSSNWFPLPLPLPWVATDAFLAVAFACDTFWLKNKISLAKFLIITPGLFSFPRLLKHRTLFWRSSWQWVNFGNFQSSGSLALAIRQVWLEACLPRCCLLLLPPPGSSISGFS